MCSHGACGLKVGEKKQSFLTLDSIFTFHLDLDWKKKNLKRKKKKRKMYTQEDNERLTEKAQIKIMWKKFQTSFFF